MHVPKIRTLLLSTALVATATFAYAQADVRSTLPADDWRSDVYLSYRILGNFKTILFFSLSISIFSESTFSGSGKLL